MILLQPSWPETTWPAASSLTWVTRASGYKLGPQHRARYVGGGLVDKEMTPISVPFEERRDNVRYLKWVKLTMEGFLRPLWGGNGVRWIEKMTGREWKTTSGRRLTAGGRPLCPDSAPEQSQLRRSTKATPLPEKGRPISHQQLKFRFPEGPNIRKDQIGWRSRAFFRLRHDLQIYPAGKVGGHTSSICAGAVCGPRAGLCRRGTFHEFGLCIGVFCCCTGLCPQTSKPLATSMWRTNLGDIRPLVLKRPSVSCRNGRQVTAPFFPPQTFGVPQRCPCLSLGETPVLGWFSLGPLKLEHGGRLFRLN